MKTVLLIDDDQQLRNALAQWLTDHGWRVLEAEDGDQGLNLALKHRPEVVLCDLLMPRVNGFQVCRSIRERRDELANTKIIVTTGRSYITDRMNALEAGADEYLVKPISPRELTNLLVKITSDTGSPNVAAASQNGSGHHYTKIKFWGVRGSIPVPGPQTVFYGGNTPCVEVRIHDQIVILDSGTGIRNLGQSLAQEFKDEPLNLTLLVTHTHWDHIQGFPFFLPAYNTKNCIRVLGFEGARKGLESTLSDQMESPYFPISMRQMPGNISIKELKDMQFKLGDIEVQAEFVNHPGICAGYRLNTPYGSMAYLPDVELFQRLRAQIGKETQMFSLEEQKFARDQDWKLMQFIRDVDVLILDSQYDADEYDSHVGWGHSCVDDSVALALKAHVKKLFLFHHDPNHDDEKVSRMVAHARELVERHRGSNLVVEAAREGMEIRMEKPAQVKPDGN